jgi:hypothetical protein
VAIRNTRRRSSLDVVRGFRGKSELIKMLEKESLRCSLFGKSVLGDFRMMTRKW